MAFKIKCYRRLMGITGEHGYKQGGDTKDNIPDWREVVSVQL